MTSRFLLEAGGANHYGRRTRVPSPHASPPMINLDVYNVFNAVLTLNYAYASWQRPRSILLARFAKISAQIDF